MLETGSGPAPTGDLIKESSEATFMQDVVEESKTTPVIVDFWAPWCGPCKTLGPALEAAVTKAGGKVRMVKVNVDENQMLAGQMRVQSIPSVFAFFEGQPVDGFQGALAPSEIQAFVDKTAALAGDDGGLEEAVAAAEEMLDQGAAVDAAQTFAAVLEEEPANAAALAGLARSHLALGEEDKALAILDNAPKEIAEDPVVLAVKAQIELAANAADAGETEDLRAKLEADANDHQARLDLGLALVAAGDAEGAIAELLELFRRDREWNDAAAKEQLFKVFESLGPKDATAKAGRRKLSSMIFA
ncbi:MAG: tetratricopeptide repeat protein [Rhodobacteraceae bacterium]|nr:tetratricopeptide repeat protein [Paracoccaceae bacterium]